MGKYIRKNKRKSKYFKGKRVRTLVRDRHAAGFYFAEWDARNDHGINLPSGVYIYRLQAGEYVESRKMLYLK